MASSQEPISAGAVNRNLPPPGRTAATLRIKSCWTSAGSRKKSPHATTLSKFRPKKSESSATAEVQDCRTWSQPAGPLRHDGSSDSGRIPSTPGNKARRDFLVAVRFQTRHNESLALAVEPHWSTGISRLTRQESELDFGVEVAGLPIDLESLRRHYTSLSDEELVALNREELTETAQKCYDEELERRELSEAPDSGTGPGNEEYDCDAFETVEDTDWLEEAACACSFVSQPGGSAAADAGNARAALQEAGIPCQISAVKAAEPSGEQPARYEYRVMVPGALNLKATSILDKEVFNPQLEADWHMHFESLTDRELGALNPDVICAGLFDRIARLKRAYNDEVARRFGHSSG